MSEYFLKPYSSYRDVKLEVDLLIMEQKSI